VDARPAWPGLIERYRERLPVGPSTPVVTLLEGGTPLVPAPVLSARTGCDVWLKVEGANPTGSFKDRGMTVAVSRALEEGARAVLCASTGNTSASAAAYAARAAIPCAVVIPEGRIALGKLAQALVHGASVLAVDGSFDDCRRRAIEPAPFEQAGRRADALREFRAPEVHQLGTPLLDLMQTIPSFLLVVRGLSAQSKDGCI
jgi:threonine synthase